MDRKRIQKIYRVYPPGYTGDSIGQLNKLLNDGYIVLSNSPISYDGKTIFNDYLIEKEVGKPDLEL